MSRWSGYSRIQLISHKVHNCQFCIGQPAFAYQISDDTNRNSEALFKRREVSMTSRTFGAKIAIIAVSTAALLSPALAQQGKGTLYAFHSPPAIGGCPGLDWHVTLGPDDSLVGFVAWDHGKRMARLEGALKKDRTFEMDAQEIGGQGRKATVKGTAGGEYVNIQINGSGSACDGVNLPIPRVVGGSGGGGG